MSNNWKIQKNETKYSKTFKNNWKKSKWEFLRVKMKEMLKITLKYQNINKFNQNLNFINIKFGNIISKVTLRNYGGYTWTLKSKV